jgi:hypothetical protein
MAIYDDGKIVGFSVPESEVRTQLEQIKEQYDIVNDRLNTDLGLSEKDSREVDKIYKD